MPVIQSIADLPFRERDPWALLNLDTRADAPAAPDLEYYGYGHARVGEIWLTTYDAPDPLPPVRNARLMALHTPDDAEDHGDDLLLEFWIDPVTCEEAGEDEDYAISVMLSRFLEIWLPRVRGDGSAVVLALCNPHHTRLTRPAGLGGATIHYPLGNVTSWRDEAVDFLGGPGALRLTADAWLTM